MKSPQRVETRLTPSWVIERRTEGERERERQREQVEEVEKLIDEASHCQR